MYFHAVFAVTFTNDRHMYQYEFHPLNLSSPATYLVKLQLEKENEIKFILASSKC